MESKLYNQEGKEAGTVTLPESVFNTPWNEDLVQQVVLSLRANARQGSAHTKDRREVSGGGKKPWRQKGTGRARHGSIRSPLWRGGGTTFGPRVEREYGQKVNKKMNARALAVVLSEKLRRKEVLFLDMLAPLAAKTKNAKNILSRLAEIPGAERIARKRENAVLIISPEKDTAVERSFRNLGMVEMRPAQEMNILDALQSAYVVITRPETALPILEKRVISRSRK